MGQELHRTPGHQAGGWLVGVTTLWEGKVRRSRMGKPQRWGRNKRVVVVGSGKTVGVPGIAHMKAVVGRIVEEDLGHILRPSWVKFRHWNLGLA